MDVHGGALYLVAGSDFRVRVFGEGGLSEIFAITRAARTVSQADVEAYRSFVQDYVPEGQRQDYLSALESPELPKVLPAYSRVLVASGGEVWARVYSQDPLEPGQWDVFTESGAFLGQVVVPPGFVPMGIRDSRLYGVWRDGLGVEHVRIYRIEDR
jgi:hypothetical protein